MSQVESLTKLESLLLDGPVGIRSLADSLDCSEDTIRRYIHQLNDLGSDTVYRPGSENGWASTRAVFSSNLSLRRKKIK